jgi:hypothetical protein
MAQDISNSDEDTVSVKEMRSALEEETRAVMKAADLRIRELTQIVHAYASGELAPTDATGQFMKHLDKWGDPIPGVVRVIQYATDEEIMADMNKAFGEHTARLLNSVDAAAKPRRLRG